VTYQPHQSEDPTIKPTGLRQSREDEACERALTQMTERIMEGRQKNPGAKLHAAGLRTNRAVHQLVVEATVPDDEVRACLKAQQDAINAREAADWEKR
jgi:hypothetical protein